MGPGHEQAHRLGGEGVHREEQGRQGSDPPGRRRQRHEAPHERQQEPGAERVQEPAGEVKAERLFAPEGMVERVGDVGQRPEPVDCFACARR